MEMMLKIVGVIALIVSNFLIFKHYSKKKPFSDYWGMLTLVALGIVVGFIIALQSLSGLYFEIAKVLMCTPAALLVLGFTIVFQMLYNTIGIHRKVEEFAGGEEVVFGCQVWLVFFGLCFLQMVLVIQV